MRRVKRVQVIVALSFAVSASAGAMNLNDTFHFITTLVVASTPHGQAQGTAFYYQHLAPTDKPGPQWRAVLNTWLVTNRHVVLPKVNGKETVPSSFALHLRKIEADRLRWEAITPSTDELHARTKVHPNADVDVAIVNVGDLLTGKIKEGEKFLQWYAVHPENFVGQNNIGVQVSDEVLLIGYPRGFYDQVNLYPIVKAAIIASRWGAHFGGKPFFLIDAKLFPGSSGSIVVSKPIDLVVKDGRILHSKEKQFAFLGVYSGEPVRHEKPVELDDMVTIQKSGYNVGVVWYADLVEEIIEDGVPFPR
jgi:Trypsin-like peptidase domain